MLFGPQIHQGQHDRVNNLSLGTPRQSHGSLSPSLEPSE